VCRDPLPKRSASAVIVESPHMDHLVERTRVADKIADEVLVETSGLYHRPSFGCVESYNVCHTSYRNAIGAFLI
jgi:hypothetical protein